MAGIRRKGRTVLKAETKVNASKERTKDANDRIIQFKSQLKVQSKNYTVMRLNKKRSRNFFTILTEAGDRKK